MPTNSDREPHFFTYHATNAYASLSPRRTHDDFDRPAAPLDKEGQP